MAKFMMLQRSSRRFSIGVPVSASRCRQSSAHAAFAVCESGFLIAWASSRMTACHCTFASVFESERSCA